MLLSESGPPRRRAAFLVSLGRGLAWVCLSALAGRAAGSELSGRALVDGGKPAPPTTAIELRHHESDLERAARLAAGKAEPPAPRVVAHPDASGRFALTAPAGNWVLSVKAPGFVPAAIQVLGFVDDAELEDVALRPEVRLPVEVRDAAGGPAAGAWISARNSEPAARRGNERASPWRRLERTDARGAATVGCISGERLQVTVVGDGAVATSATSCAGGTPLRVTLPADAQRRVVVRGVQNEPLADAVLLESDSYLPLARTASDGGAAVPVPAAGREIVLLASAHAFLQTTLPPRTADGSALTLRLEPRPRVVGRVLEVGTRRPLAGALIWAWANPGGVVTSDTRGEFTLDDDPARVLAAAQGHGDAFLAPADTRAPVTLLLEPVRTLTGRVLDAARAPLAGARIAARAIPSMRSGHAQMRRGEASSRTDGSFRLVGLSPADGYRIVARRDGFAPATVTVLPADSGPAAPLEIVLGTGNEVSLRILDADGKPVERAHAALRGRDPEELRPRRILELVEGDDALGAESDAAGTARWTHVAPGSYDVGVQARGFAPLTLPGVEVRPSSAEKPARVDLGSVRMQPGVALAGIAVDTAGAPLAGVSVWARARSEMLLGSGFRDPDATTASDGTFTIADVAPGFMNVFASAEGRTDAQVEGVSVPTESPLRLVLPPLSRVRGRVVDADGRPVRDVELQRMASRRAEVAIFSRRASPRAVSGEDGAFVLGDVPAGAMRLAAAREGFLSAVSGELDVPVGRDLEGVELVLRPAGAVSGRVVDADGDPAAGATVRVQGDRGPWSVAAPVEADGDGRYRLPAVPPGVQTLIAESADSGRAAQEIEVRAGENVLDFRLAGGFELSGTVVDEHDHPVAGARVALVETNTYSAGGPREAVAAADGSFTLRGVRQGRLRLQARATGYSDASLGPLAVEGPMSGLTLRLSLGTGTIAGALRGLDLRELASAEVMAVSPAGFWKRGSVDARGRYRVAGVSPGEWRVQATVDLGRRRAQGSTKVDESAAETVLDLDFSSGFSLSGRVTRNQQALASAYVFAASMEAGSHGSVQTDSDGRFRLDGLAAGKYSVGVRTFGAQLHQEIVELSEDREITIALVAGVVRGRVLDAADGSPLPGARLEIQPADAHMVQMFFGDGGTMSDARGSFVLTDVVAGRWKVVAALDGYASGTAAVELAEGGEASVDVTLEPSEGVALDLSRPGAQSVEVVALGANGEAVFGGNFVSTDTGRVRLSTLPLGTYRIVVATAADAVATVTATAPGPPVPVLLVPGGRIEISIPALATEDQAGMVTLHSESLGDFGVPRWGNLQKAWSVSNGRVELAGVPPGTWTVNAAGTVPGQSWSATLSVGSGALVAVELK